MHLFGCEKFSERDCYTFEAAYPLVPLSIPQTEAQRAAALTALNEARRTWDAASGGMVTERVIKHGGAVMDRFSERKELLAKGEYDFTPQYPPGAKVHPMPESKPMTPEQRVEWMREQVEKWGLTFDPRVSYPPEIRKKLEDNEKEARSTGDLLMTWCAAKK